MTDSEFHKSVDLCTYNVYFKINEYCGCKINIVKLIEIIIEFKRQSISLSFVNPSMVTSALR